jgi:hypothetical protein
MKIKTDIIIPVFICFLFLSIVVKIATSTNEHTAWIWKMKKQQCILINKYASGEARCFKCDKKIRCYND